MATYYVATDGNDSTGDGSIGNPWLTITKGQSMLSAGDLLYIRGGYYRESVIMDHQGSTGNPITLKAYTGETPILDGSIAVTGWTQCASDEAFLTVQSVTNPNYANIYKLDIPAASLNTDINKFVLFENYEQLRIARTPDQEHGYGLNGKIMAQLPSASDGLTTYITDATNLTQADDYWAGAWVDIWSHNAGNIIVRRTIASSSQSGNSITFNTALSYALAYNSDTDYNDTYSIVNHPHLINGAGEFAYTTTPDGEGNYTFYVWPLDTDDLTANMRVQSKEYGIKASFLNNIIIDGLTVIGYTSRGITAYQYPNDYLENISVKNCTVTDCYGDGIYLRRVNNGTVEDCTVERVEEYGIDVVEADNGLISGCTVNNSARTNIVFYTMTNSKMLYNNCLGSSGVHGNGMVAYINCNRILIAYNNFYGSNLAIQSIIDVIVYANVFDRYDEATDALDLWPDDYQHTQGIHLYLNNTIVGSENNGGISLFSQTSPYPEYYIVNNVIDGFNYFDVDTIVQRDYNSYTGYGWRQLDPELGWSIATHEINNTSTDISTMFNDPGEEGQDYTPKAGGSLVASGVDIQSILSTTGADEWFSGFDFTKDKAGNSWSSVPSIGAYEYSAPTVLYATDDGVMSQTENLWNTASDGGGSGYSFDIIPDTTTLDANGHIIEIDTSITVSKITNSSNGYFYVSEDGITITADLENKTIGSTYSTLLLVQCLSGDTVNIVGDSSSLIDSDALNSIICFNQTGVLNITGNITGGSEDGGSNSRGLINTSAGTVNITGDVSGGDCQGACGVTNSSTGTINITGDITGGGGASSHGVYNTSTGTILITGAVTGGSVVSSIGLYNSDFTTSSTTVKGNIIFNTQGPPISGNVRWWPTSRYYMQIPDQNGDSMEVYKGGKSNSIFGDGSSLFGS